MAANSTSGDAMTHDLADSLSGQTGDVGQHGRIARASELREQMKAARKGKTVFVWPRLWPRRRENHVGRLNDAVRGSSRAGRLTPQ